MPVIARNGVNKSYLELTDLQFLDPTPNTVVMTQKVILHSPSIFTPTLDPFNATVWLVNNGTFAAAPLNILAMPRIHALHPESNASVINQEITLLSQDQIADYTTQVLSNKNVSTALTGKTKLHEGHLPVVNINYNTTTTYAGLFFLIETTSLFANDIRTQRLSRVQRHGCKGQPYCCCWRAKLERLCIYSQSVYYHRCHGMFMSIVSVIAAH
jgi:hypothetical protein